MIKMTDNDVIYKLKLKLKSATKLKLQKEKELYIIRDKERQMNEELVMVKAENEFLGGQLEEIKSQIAQARHQISMIVICSTSEKTKIEAQINNLENHRKAFQDIFDKERELKELRLIEIKEKEAAEEEMLRQKEKEAAARSEQQDREAATIEAECAAIERECAVLKKRNNAIMLQLRRKLFETENARRELMKRNSASDGNHQ